MPLSPVEKYIKNIGHAATDFLGRPELARLSQRSIVCGNTGIHSLLDKIPITDRVDMSGKTHLCVTKTRLVSIVPYGEKFTKPTEDDEEEFEKFFRTVLGVYGDFRETGSDFEDGYYLPGNDEDSDYEDEEDYEDDEIERKSSVRISRINNTLRLSTDTMYDNDETSIKHIDYMNNNVEFFKDLMRIFSENEPESLYNLTDLSSGFFESHGWKSFQKVKIGDVYLDCSKINRDHKSHRNELSSEGLLVIGDTDVPYVILGKNTEEVQLLSPWNTDDSEPATKRRRL